MRTATAVAVSFLAASNILGQDLAGVWRGQIHDREKKQQIEFELQVNPRGTEPAGRLQPLGRGAATPFFIDVATLADGVARFEIQTLRIVIEGKVSGDGNSISATWTQFGRDRQPVQLKRAASATPPTFFDPLVEIRIPKHPTAVRTDGADRLYYEIHLANYTQERIELQRVDVLLGARTVTLAGEALARQTVSYGVSIPPDKSGVVLMALSFSSVPPNQLVHRVTFSSAARSTTLQTQPMPVLRDPVRISPPVRGANWWAGSGPDSSLHHRAAIVPMDGRFTIAQRFAFDFSRRVPDSDEFERGDRRKLDSSPSYGADVVAVADATVSLVRDGLPDAPPYEIAPPHPITKDTFGGNLIVLDLGGQRWAVYAHLQPGSLTVKAGDRVRRGDVIARLGNSASYSPHLHFHVVDGPDPFSSEGVPFVFNEFSHDGKVHRNEMPSGGWTIDFAERKPAP